MDEDHGGPQGDPCERLQRLIPAVAVDDDRRRQAALGRQIGRLSLQDQRAARSAALEVLRPAIKKAEADLQALLPDDEDLDIDEIVRELLAEEEVN